MGWAILEAGKDFPSTRAKFGRALARTVKNKALYFLGFLELAFALVESILIVIDLCCAVPKSFHCAVG
jgi:hypothetical protein